MARLKWPCNDKLNFRNMISTTGNQSQREIKIEKYSMTFHRASLRLVVFIDLGRENKEMALGKLSNN